MDLLDHLKCARDHQIIVLVLLGAFIFLIVGIIPFLRFNGHVRFVSFTFRVLDATLTMMTGLATDLLFEFYVAIDRLTQAKLFCNFVVFFIRILVAL